MLFIVIAFVFGAVIGSFLNVVAYRLPRGDSLISPGSRCPTCEKPIPFYDNVPIISWLILRGHCRKCNAPISARYIVVETVTAMLFALLVAVRGVEPELIIGLPFMALMVSVAVIDLEHRIVPNKLLLVAAVWGLGASLAVQSDLMLEQLIAALAAGGFLLLAALAYPSGMGMGDVKLAAVMGLYLGRAVGPALLFGFALGAVVGIAIMIREGRSARKKAIPFAPFLAAGGVIAQLAGLEVIDWYTGTFF